MLIHKMTVIITEKDDDWADEDAESCIDKVEEAIERAIENGLPNFKHFKVELTEG